VTPPPRIGEGLSASRSDDLGSAHILISLDIGLFQADDPPVLLAPGVAAAAAHLRSHVAMR
jgi:hypothetical protein